MSTNDDRPTRDDTPAPHASSRTPRYESLAASLVAEIRSGRFPPDSLLPTEHELCDRHGLSRHTVRAALQRLIDIGLVSRQPGVGTRVKRSEPSVGYSIAMGSMSDLAGYARAVRLRIDRSERIRAWGGVAESLGCREGSVWLHLLGRRFRSGERTPVAVSEIFLRDRYPGIEALLEQPRAFIPSILETHYAEPVEEIGQDMYPVAMSEADAARLSLPAGTAGLEVVRRYYGARGRLLLLGRVVNPSGSFAYSMRFTRRSPD
jgi:DNA-binding GntR family transcriptional regulator